jgi:sugar lactone lactonase YvrE
LSAGLLLLGGVSGVLAQASPAPVAPVRGTPAGNGGNAVPTDLPPPLDVNVLDAAARASGLLSPAAHDPSNAPNFQPDPYTANTEFLKLPRGRVMGSTSSVSGDSKGNIWVADRCGAPNSCRGSTLDPIMEFDSRGQFVKSFGAGKFIFPHGIFIDRNDHIWVADLNVDDKIGDDVIEFDSDGKVLMTLGTPGMIGNDAKTFSQVNSVAVAADGTIFVADGHWSRPTDNARISKFDAQGKFIKSWGSHGIGAGQLNAPHSMAIDQEGHLYVADRINNRIQEFDPDGTPLQIFTQFGRPSGVYIDKNDIMYVADSESNDNFSYGYHPGWRNGIRIGSVKDGIVSAFIPVEGIRGGAEGVWADGKGNVYGAEVQQRRIVRYTHN